MTKIEEQLVRIIGRVNKLLRSNPWSKIMLEDWEYTYKKLKGLKGFFDDAPWDVIEKEVKEHWISNARKDKAFKEYYLLRREYDKLEVLVK